MHFPLVREVLRSGESETRGNDTLNGRVVGKVKEQNSVLSLSEKQTKGQFQQ